MSDHTGERRKSMIGTGSESSGTPMPRGVDVTRRAFLRTAVVSGMALAGGLIAPSVITPARGAEKSMKIGIWAGPDGHGVGIQVSTVALTYDPREINTAPTSWEAFWDPKYKGKVAVPSLSSTNGINLVVMAAALATGKPFKEAQ
jgi:Bacterial extracellular solute-binding protein